MAEKASRQSMRRLNVAEERRRIDRIWPGSSPECGDLTRDRLRSRALWYLLLIEKWQPKEAAPGDGKSAFGEPCGIK